MIAPTENYSDTLLLEPYDNKRLVNLCGPLDTHLRSIEYELQIMIKGNGNTFTLTGMRDAVQQAKETMARLYTIAASESIESHQIALLLSDKRNGNKANDSQPGSVAPVIRTKRLTVHGKTPHQQDCIRRITTHELSFAIGPAGTGKTFLAVAAASAALEQGKVLRLVLTRPAVEAGERLGFLPGDLSEKVDPFLRPLYDALYELLGVEVTMRYLEQRVIEVAPLAFMRGRTLNDAYVILDEAQNATQEQMKMFLTRVGMNTTTIIAGDLTQSDLPQHRQSGLHQAVDLLQEVRGISFSFFDTNDVIRSPLVARILKAYARE